MLKPPYNPPTIAARKSNVCLEQQHHMFMAKKPAGRGASEYKALLWQALESVLQAVGQSKLLSVLKGSPNVDKWKWQRMAFLLRKVAKESECGEVLFDD